MTQKVSAVEGILLSSGIDYALFQPGLTRHRRFQYSRTTLVLRASDTPLLTDDDHVVNLVPTSAL